jgi:hypothetical protein
MSDKDLEVLQEEVPVEETQEETEDNETIEIPKKVKKPVKTPSGCKVPDRPKRERTQAQKDAWARCLAKRQEKRDQRQEVKKTDAQLMKEYKASLAKRAEDKVIRQAVNLKKKAVMVEEYLDELGEGGEEIPLEVVKEKIKQTRKAPPKPRQPRQQPVEVYEPKIPALTFF